MRLSFEGDCGDAVGMHLGLRKRGGTLPSCILSVCFCQPLSPRGQGRKKQRNFELSCVSGQDLEGGSSFSHQRPRKEKTCPPYGLKERAECHQELGRRDRQPTACGALEPLSPPWWVHRGSEKRGTCSEGCSRGLLRCPGYVLERGHEGTRPWSRWGTVWAYRTQGCWAK